MSARDELEALRAQIDTAEKESEKARQAEADADELAALKKVIELRSQFPGEEYHLVKALQYTFVIKSPSEEQYGLFNRAIADESRRPTANRILVMAGTVYPDADTLESRCAKRGHLWGSLSARIVELAGSDTTVKKL